MRYSTAAFLAVLILFAAPSFAHVAKVEGKVDVEIVSEGNGVLPTIPFRNYLEGRTRTIKRYLEARSGENYSIVLKNNMPERVGVVLAVDGRNIITGKRSSLKSHEKMYILEPFGSAKLEGWRTDGNTVHTFYFTPMSDSYAVRTFGDSSAIGVIAVAVFREKSRPVLHERKDMKKEAPAPLSGGAAESMNRYDSNRAGTGFGDTRYSPVIKVAFDPEGTPYEKVLVKYEWREVLCKKGLLQCLPEEKNRLWDDNGYAPYPPGHDSPLR
ncbi:MAG TPA: hypothetical protein VN328_06600 [Thermodesulfovibrionales bacterium]|nr:hypothetical protein [Thermodesulfovibrionales bacterium]